MDALDQSALHELEDEAAARRELLGAFLQVRGLLGQLLNLVLHLLVRVAVFGAFDGFQAVVQALNEFLDLVLLERLLHEGEELGIVRRLSVQQG